MTTIKKPKYKLIFNVNVETSGPSDAQVFERCDIEITSKAVEPWWWAYTEPDKEFLYYHDSVHLFRPDITRIEEAMYELARTTREAMSAAGYKETRKSQRNNVPDWVSTNILKKRGA